MIDQGQVGVFLQIDAGFTQFQGGFGQGFTQHAAQGDIHGTQFQTGFAAAVEIDGDGLACDSNALIDLFPGLIDIQTDVPEQADVG